MPNLVTTSETNFITCLLLLYLLLLVVLIDLLLISDYSLPISLSKIYDAIVVLVLNATKDFVIVLPNAPVPSIINTMLFENS